MLLTKEIEIVCKSDKKYYIDKGYDWKYNELIKVNINDLLKGSHQSVDVLCDYCLEEIMKKEYRIYIKQRDNSVIKKDCCNNCKGLKIKESNLINYGANNVFQLSDIKEKTKKTMIEYYGVENPSFSEIIKDKRLKTVREKYGVDNVFQLNEIKQKRKITMEKRYGNEHTFLVKELMDKVIKTMLDKFGVEHPIQNSGIREKIENTNMDRYNAKCSLGSKIIQEKSRKTCLEKYGVNYFILTEEHKRLKKITMMERYGVEFPLQNVEILTKARKTMFKNGTAPCSTQQKYIHNLLGGELNYPINNCSVDIAFPDDKLYIEYNGSGHNLNVLYKQMDQKSFDQKEIKRYYFLKGKGYYGIYIISRNDNIPYDDVIIKIINKAKEYLLLGHSWIEFDIDEGKIKCSQYEVDYDFGELRKIFKTDLMDNIS